MAVSSSTNPTNLTKVNSNPLVTGNGVTGTGSLRVTVASDNTAFGIKITDGTTTVPVKAASTIAATTDPSLVVALSPNTPAKLWDGTNIVPVKGASTVAAATDPSLVVALSPNSPAKIWDGSNIAKVTATNVPASFVDNALVVAFHGQNSGTRISNGTYDVAIKAPSTVPAATDSALVVSVNPINVVRTRPSEIMRDPVDKLRVSEPQALMDTDFEYGTQPTKWESITLLNNRPTVFYDNTTPMTISAISVSTKTVTVTGTSATFTISVATGTTMTVTAITSGSIFVGMGLAGSGITAGTTVTAFGASTSGGIGTYTISASMTMSAGTVTGTPGIGSVVFVQGTFDPSYADGYWLVQTSTGTSISFNTISAPAATLYDTSKTNVYPASFYTNSSGMGWAFNPTNVGTTVTVTTILPHGLHVGNTVFIKGLTATTNPPNGNWVVATTPSSNSFTFTSDLTATGAISNSGATLYVRPAGYVDHRAFDGGVAFSNKSPYHGYQLIRQTRRYFRYQSGKGIQFSTGTTMKPAFTVDRLTASGTTVTVTTKYPHGVATGLTIIVSGATDANYNGTFTITATPLPTTFTYTAGSAPGTSPDVGFPIIVSPSAWYGGTNRVGMYDQQNGFYFEFDGVTLYAVIRKSVDQIPGTIAVSNGSTQVTGTNTLFSKHLKPNDHIVIRGMTYTVENIGSETALAIYPEYRGPSITQGGIVSKTVNTRYAQSAWNIDRVDGTGGTNNPSGYNINLARMQMFYADYSWYGAGAVRFGFKDGNGEVIYVHRVANTNVNVEAYMRSGNLPARYETNTLPYYTYLTATLANTANNTNSGIVTVADTTGFPASGTIVIKASSGGTGISAAIEYINYSSKTATTFVIGTGGTNGRIVPGGETTAQTFTYSATAPTLVELYSPQAATTISHWGSSVIMDGKFDDDKSFVFNAGMTTSFTNITQGVRVPLISLRLGPAVDNSVTGLLGTRELINRMQLTLRSMDTYTTGSGWRIELFLNARVGSSRTWASAGGSSLAQLVFHQSSDTVQGGESIYGYFTNQSGATSQDLNSVRDIGNSIVGGGTISSMSNNNNDKYPDGPDIITICATPLVNTNTINARISWTEAQA